MALQRPVHNYYTVLGLTRDASDAEIKRAFHKQARQWHPDKCDAPDAAERFRLAHDAFETLSDPSHRQAHDAGLCLRPPAACRRPQPAAAPSCVPRARARMPAAAAGGTARGLAGLATTASAGAQGLSVSDLHTWCEECGVAWPGQATEREEICSAVAEAARSQLDRRVAARSWGQLLKEDLAVWLLTHGCLKDGLQGDLMSKELLIQMVIAHIREPSGSGQQPGLAASGGRTPATPQHLHIPRSRRAQAPEAATSRLPRQRPQPPSPDAAPIRSRARGRRSNASKPTMQDDFFGEDLLADFWAKTLPADISAGSSGTPEEASAKTATQPQVAGDRIPEEGRSKDGAKRKRPSSSSSSGSSSGSSGSSSEAQDVERPGPPVGAGGGTVTGDDVLQCAQNLRKGLEAYRQAGSCTIKDGETASRIFDKLEAFDAEGKIDIPLLRSTRLGVELNSAWWRHDAPGRLAQRASTLVTRWKERCRAVQAARAAR
mmetsp:Transcript_28480/g.81560  ORF Transcript_28480/g.81560 Transcript_28480/m.81560 type:complete len:489 (+) Transcript_28480:29-1495(+)